MLQTVFMRCLRQSLCVYNFRVFFPILSVSKSLGTARIKPITNYFNSRCKNACVHKINEYF